MKGLWEHWSGTIAVTAVAIALGILAIWFQLYDNSWASLAWGLAGALALVAASGYRTRRDPALLLIAAGSSVLALWFFIVTMTDAVTAVKGTIGAWLTGLRFYGPTFGLVTFAACLAMTIPWRDRRGRSPLRVSTVALFVAAPNLIAGIVVGMLGGTGTNTQYRFEAAAIALVALVSGARAITRGGWHRWIGGASFALLLAAAGLFILAGDWASELISVTALLWFLFMPSVAVVATLLGVLLSQRTEAVRVRRTSDRATEVMEGRAEIASIVAHDVRGPAGTIRSVAGSLRTSYTRLRDDERLEFVGMIEQESLRLLRVADQMSLGLKTDAGTLPYNLVARDVEAPVLQGLHEAEVGSREVRVDLDPSLRARVDERWLAEAVRQGLENALKFSPADTPIDLRSRADGASGLIEIEDRGLGIPPEMREAVFGKFARWRPTGYEDRSGSGLGLFVVRSIAREHGGEAIVTEGSSGGTILQIRLPLEGAT